MRRRTKARPSLVPWLVGGVLLAGTGAPAAQGLQPSGRGRHHACLAPSGGDDTAALQEALDRCSGARRPCAVTLCAGVFETGILRVREFRGTLRGAGPQRTLLRALPDLHVSGDLRDFFRDDPLAPGTAWPYLVQFVEGEGRVEDLGILVPAPPPGSAPTTGWYLLGDGPIFELRGALLFTGRQPVDFEVDGVRVEAEDPGTGLGTTVFHGIELGGLLFDPSDPGEFPVVPARGRFRVEESSFDGVLTGTVLSELASARVLVARNRYRSTVAVEVIDADRSRLAVLGNRWTVSYRGVQVRQNLDGAPSRDSRLLVRANRGRLEPLFAGFGDGLSFVDPAGAASEPGATDLRVQRNSLSVADGAGAAATGIAAAGAGRLRVALNRLAGPAGVGVEVDATEGCRVWRNSTHALETRDGPDLHLGIATSDCVAIVETDDVVVDEGVANRVIRR